MCFFFFSLDSRENSDVRGTGNPITCPRCHNTVRPELIERYTENRLYWVIPIGRSDHRYRLECPICRAGYDLTKEEFERKAAKAGGRREFRRQQETEDSRKPKTSRKAGNC